MPAKDHLNNYQYRLFMTGDEIKGLVSESVDRELGYEDVDPETGGVIEVPEESMEEMWKGKRTIGLKKKLENEGVRRHVTIVPNKDGTFTMGQGHHRVQASSDLAKEGKTLYVPVVYDEDFNYSGSNTGEYAKRYPHVEPEKF
jgi:hypothetical protein